jgi:hypothetical protein
MKVYAYLVGWVLLGTGVPIWLHMVQHTSGFNLVQALMTFFSWLNVLICLWEIALFLYIKEIKEEFKQLEAKYGEKRFDAAIDFFNTDLTAGEAFSLRTWTKVWSTYSLYDPSYSNRESFGFWIDSGNGVTTIIPSILWIAGMTYDIGVSPATLGIMGIIVHYQEFYGTVVYFSTFFCNKRHHGKSFIEVLLFVGLSNGLWFFFPLLGMYASVQLIHQGDHAVFGWSPSTEGPYL